jgi:hypothetical protein
MRWIFENLWMKLLALLIGSAIWLHVATEKIYNYEVTLPVTRIDLRDRHTLSSTVPDSVRVEVSAKGKQLLRALWQQQGVRINATKFNSGDYTLNLSPENVSLVNPSKSIAIDEVKSPAAVEMSVDIESTVDLPILPLVNISCDDGFAVGGKIDVSPSRAQLTGPKGVVKTLKSVTTVARELTGLRSSISIWAPVAAPPGYRMKVQPDSVQLKIPIIPVKTRTYDNLPIVIYNAPVGMRVATSPAHTQVEVSGPPGEIELLNRNSLTASVDYRAKSVNGYSPLKVDCPTNFHVKHCADDSARIILSGNADSGN